MYLTYYVVYCILLSDEREVSSMRLGESASMYERDEEEDHGHDPSPTECEELIVSHGVLCLLYLKLYMAYYFLCQRGIQNLAPEPKAPPCSEVDAAGATADRLRQMGVSFISPEELRRSARRSSRRLEREEECGFDTLYQPRLAALSSGSSGAGVVGEESLGANNLALRFLDDGALSRLARSSGNRVRAVECASLCLRVRVFTVVLPPERASSSRAFQQLRRGDGLRPSGGPHVCGHTQVPQEEQVGLRRG